MENGRLTLAERFWPKVHRRGSDDCWLWVGARTSKTPGRDYGYIGRTPPSRLGPERPAKRAHVASWELHNGPVPDGMVVCHRCDNPPCVNPAHLFAAPQAENCRDRSAKGRDADRRGSRNPNAKLTAEQVAELRRRYRAGERQIALAAEFGVDQTTVSGVVLGKTWT